MSKTLTRIIGVVFGLYLVAFGPEPAFAKKNVAEELYVFDPSGTYLEWLRELPEISLDHRDANGYEVYGPVGTAELLDGLSIPYWRQVLPLSIVSDYPTSAEFAALLREVVANYSNIMTIESIGESVMGQPLLVVKISDNPTEDEIEPEVKYISSMHGNEITGRDVLLRFIAMIGESYANNANIRSLVDNTEIYIMPSMNPDGSDLHQRGNRNFADLNRDFPDFTTRDNQNTTEGREPETQAVMRYQRMRQFALSANFHGGSAVVNYPWDTMSERHPFDAMIREISLQYAAQVPYMRNSREFPNGVTNGYDWYTLDGGMQDWSYYWHNDLQVTIEISGDKWPDYSEIDNFYEQNKESLLGYLAAVHQGAGFSFGARTDMNGMVAIFAIRNGNRVARGEYSFHGGEFYKVLPPGEYQFHVAAENGTGEPTRIIVPVTVSPGIEHQNGNYIYLQERL